MTRALALTVAIAALAAGVSAASTGRPRSDPPAILTVDRDGTDVRTLAVGAHPIGAQDGRIAFFRDGTVWVMAADGTGQRAVAPAGPIEDVWMPASWSSRGQIGFGRWDHGRVVLMAADASTGALREVARSRFRGAGAFSWAPRGGRVAYLGEYDSIGTRANPTLEVVRADGSGRRVIARVPPREGYGLYEPAWSPRGDWIVFRRLVHRRSDSLYLIGPEGGTAEKLVQGRSATWSPSGDRLLYVAGSELRTLDLSTRRVRRIATARGITRVAWSPDGGRVAFATASRVQVVRASDGRVLSTPITGEVDALFFSVDGARLVYTVVSS
jgi:Tol biopolymer transport system component